MATCKVDSNPTALLEQFAGELATAPLTRGGHVRKVKRMDPLKLPHHATRALLTTVTIVPGLGPPLDRLFALFTRGVRFLHTLACHKELIAIDALVIAERQGLMATPPTFGIWNSDCSLFTGLKKILFFVVGDRALDEGHREETMPTTISAASIFRFIVFFGVSAAYFMFFT